MAAATVTQTEWGYYVTGGTDATTVYTGRRYIRSVVFSAGTTNDTATLTTTKNISGAVTNFLVMASPGVANQVECPWHLDDGVPADSMAVTLSNTGGKLFIYVR